VALVGVGGRSRHDRGLLDPAADGAVTTGQRHDHHPAAVGNVRVETIDLGGQEAYGLAVDARHVWAISYQAGTLSRVDPGTSAVIATLQPGPGSAVVLATGNAVWVAGSGGSPDASRLYRLDPGTERVVATIDAGDVCCDLSEGGGSIWAVDPRGSVLRIDPATNRITQRLTVHIDRSVHTNAVYGGGFVWVASDSTKLMRVDPRSGAVREFDVGGGVPFLAQDGLVWGASPTQLWAVDERTGAVKRTVRLTDSTEVMSLAVGLDAIWVGLRHAGRVGAVLRLDPATGQVLDELRQITIPARIVIGFGSAWVTDSGSSSLYRLSPKS
jgi:streptogramin lyase